ncbi:MAG: spore coat associated protein CotJA [Clostridia bacterium]|nr:spore coat associated protein CotJA [Clostridia bacterium]
MCSNRYINNSFNNNNTTINADDELATGGTTGCAYSRASEYSFPSNLRYGSAYVPVQTFRTVYSPEDGLSYGTMYPELVRPYYPNQSMAEMDYLRNYNERGCRM